VTLYLIYSLDFILPLMLVLLVGRRLLRGSWTAVALGFVAFFVAGTLVLVSQTVAPFFGVAADSVAMAVLISTGAGVFEEGARLTAFSALLALKRPLERANGVMYALGHSGMEAMFFGAMTMFVLMLLAWVPEHIPEPRPPELDAFAAMGAGSALADVLSRVILGPIIHSVWSLVVLLAVARRQLRYFFLAVAWHFAHDMMAIAVIPRLESEIWVNAWLAFVALFYSAALVYLFRVVWAPGVEAKP
jgi:uncharacterized membrane protein YhfC